MKILELDSPDHDWKGVGVYPTPNALVKEFATFIFRYITKGLDNNKPVKLLDIFCGDGRLGRNIEAELQKRNYPSNVTFVEVMDSSISKIPAKSNYSIQNINVFNFHPNDKFDLVVSNPPYYVLNSTKSAKLGINWSTAKLYSKNLYTLGVLKGLELCREGGILCVIAPFGYLRGCFSDNFINSIEELCETVIVKANDARNAFQGVNQDIAFQCFVKRSKKSGERGTDWKFGYNDHPITSIVDFERINTSVKEENNGNVNVKVGPVVWNRMNMHLRQKESQETSVVIYGSNIRHDTSFDFNIGKLKKKQRIKTLALSANDIIRKPAILIRRTLRGNPGGWIVDSAILTEDHKGQYTAENHTIVLEIEGFSREQVENIRLELVELIKNYYYISGSPTISTKVVRSLTRTVIINYNV